MTSRLPRVLSCIQPTAEMHIGNYFGAIVNWVELQKDHDCIYGVVDLHAMTMPYEPAELLANTREMVLSLMACGIDPERSLVFIQSLVPEHAELYWILGCYCAHGDLKRMTQFKEKSRQVKGRQDEFVSVGLFTYPVLQAADILIYRAQYVPVGRDQEQHLELSRELARRFNQKFGDLFPEPQPKLTEIPKVMSLSDPTRKMSKSLGKKHYVGLFEEESTVRDKIRSAVTDSGESLKDGEMSPGVANLFEILRACGRQEALASLRGDFERGVLQYSALKEAAADALVDLTSGLRARRRDIEERREEVDERVREMSSRARRIAGETLAEVRHRVGLP